MEISLANEAYVFFGSIAGGFLLGIVNDFLKSLKCKKANKIVFIGISDVFSCVVLALLSFIVIFFLNDGKIRWYEIFGIFMGYILYYLTISSFVIIFFDKIKKLIIKIFVLLIKPLAFAVKMLKIPAGKVKNVIKTSKKCVKTVKNKQKTKIRQIKYIFKKI